MKLVKQLHDNELICNIKYNKSSILSKEICLNAHNHHHKTFDYNFGYYTTILDRCFGTLHPDSERVLKEKSSHQIFKIN